MLTKRHTVTIIITVCNDPSKPLVLCVQSCYTMYIVKLKGLLQMMYSNRKQLAMDLCYLVQGDYELLNEIIVEYCESISDKRFNDLEEYCSQEIRSIV